MKVRRIVTGHDADGRALVLSDGLIGAKPLPDGKASFAVIWKTSGSPVDNDDAADRAAEPTALVHDQGTILRVVETPEGTISPMHRTNSLDYGIVLSGRVELILDDGSTTLIKEGDIVVQRGTIHAWRNPGPGPNRMAFVLIAAKPATAGGRTLEPAHADIGAEP